MRIYPAAVILACSLLLTACEKPAPVDDSSIANGSTESAQAQIAHEQYAARQFYESTSYLLASELAWSPDGSKLLFGSDASGIFNIYSLQLDTGETTPLTASSKDSLFPVSYFPNDERIIYRSDSGGNERSHLYVSEPGAEDPGPVDLTPGDEVRATFAGWSADRSRFYVLENSRDPRAMDLYEYQADDYKRKRIWENDGSYTVADLHLPHVALQKSRSNADTDVYLINLSDEQPEPALITPHVGDVAHTVYTFSPDGATLIYSTNESSEFQQAWSYDLRTGEKSPSVVASWDVIGVRFSNTGRYRSSIVNEDAAIKARIRDLQDARDLTLDLPEGSVRSIRFSRADQRVAFLITTDTSPLDIFTADLTTGEVQRRTTALNAEIDESNLVTSRVVRYASFDDLQIPAILYQPRNASASNPAPALVWVHGGPGGQSIQGYNANIQYLVNHGYAVLAANNRGSSGYGKTFFHLDDRRHGEVDLDDIVHAKSYLASLDWVAGNRIGILGGSYGGYMVGAALAFRPGVFDVGVNIFGVMNWVRTLKSIPDWWGPNRDSLFAELGDPAIEEKRLREISPLFHAEKITTPLLVIQGANDPRVLQVESDEIVAAVRRNEVPVEYVLFDDEGHGFTKRDNRIEAAEAIRTFLDNHL